MKFINMKRMFVLLTIFLMALGVAARVGGRFHGWGDLADNSPYIAVARCGNPTVPNSFVQISPPAKFDSEVQIVLVLKGTNVVKPTRLLSDHDLYPGKNYLVFGYCNDGVYQAYEDYRVVPLGQ